jgi:hypothetical protein
MKKESNWYKDVNFWWNQWGLGVTVVFGSGIDIAIHLGPVSFIVGYVDIKATEYPE